ncbi:hypothetical protein ABZ714_19705 [Streptomyces sp. NPDC006798]|uniref:SbtR family transcriptional regulator n=1 Tax=Streptomyces sp. NPDC006798 TaxID=3155462 RepID=UPI00340BA1AE
MRPGDHPPPPHPDPAHRLPTPARRHRNLGRRTGRAPPRARTHPAPHGTRRPHSSTAAAPTPLHDTEAPAGRPRTTGPGQPADRPASANPDARSATPRHQPADAAPKPARGAHHRATHPPVQALFGFLHDVVERSRGRRHVCDAVTAEGHWPHPLLTASTRRFRRTLTALLHAAQHTGGIRADLGPDDITALAIGCAALLGAHPDRAAALRLVHRNLDTLRPAEPVTKQADFRDVRCAACGTPLPHPATAPPHRPPGRYCGAACRRRAHRGRAAAGPDGGPL